MNTISITAEIDSTVLRPTRCCEAGALTAPRLRAPAVWLPVPRLPKNEASKGRPVVTPAAARIHPPRTLPGEKLFLGLLTLAATIGVVYGFWCLVDLVQNWALFRAGVGRLIQ